MQEIQAANRLFSNLFNDWNWNSLVLTLLKKFVKIWSKHAEDHDKVRSKNRVYCEIVEQSCH